MARRRSRKSSALAMPAVARQWLGGMDLMDMGAALGGLAAATMIPGILVPTVTTMTHKIVKLLASFGSAIAAGFLFKQVSPSASKFAIAGGVAGALAQSLAIFTGIKIGQPLIRAPIAMRRIAESRALPNSEDAGVQVSTT